MKVKIKKLSENAVVPKKAHSTDAGFDLVATSYNLDDEGNDVYGTGLAFEIPEGYVGLLFPRSSNAKKNMILSNSVGVIDSGYRGEVMFKFKPIPDMRRNMFSAKLLFTNGRFYNVGDRIGQMVIIPYPEIEFVESDDLSESDRGEGGYGSTGK